MRATAAVVAVFSLAFSSVEATGETVRVVRGKVSINHGDGYRPIKVSAAVSQGTSVLVSPGGAAKIIYSDGCTQTIEAGEVYIVERSSPCGSFSSPNTDADLAIGATVVGAGVAAALIIANDDDNPASK